MRTYIPPLILSTCHIAFLYWATGRLITTRRVWIGSLVSFILALFIGGYNETFTLVQLISFSELAGLFMLTKREHSRRELMPLLLSASAGAALALTIMLISPGTARRQDIFVTQSLDIRSILEITSSGYTEYLTSISSNVNKIIAVVGLLFMAAWVGAQFGDKLAGKWLVLGSVASGFIISYISLLPSAYGLGQMPGLRTFTVPTFVLVISIGYGGLLLGKWISGVNVEGKLNPVTATMMLCAILFISVSSWLNAKTLYDERRIYIEYAEQWDDIDAQIKQAKLENAESVTIPATNNWARLDQPNQNPKYWATACYSEFYGIQVYGPPSGP